MHDSVKLVELCKWSTFVWPCQAIKLFFCAFMCCLTLSLPKTRPHGLYRSHQRRAGLVHAERTIWGHCLSYLDSFCWGLFRLNRSRNKEKKKNVLMHAAWSRKDLIVVTGIKKWRRPLRARRMHADNSSVQKKIGNKRLFTKFCERMSVILRVWPQLHRTAYFLKIIKFRWRWHLDVSVVDAVRCKQTPTGASMFFFTGSLVPAVCFLDFRKIFCTKGWRG